MVDFSATPFRFDPSRGSLLMDIPIRKYSLTLEQFPAFGGFSQGGIGVGTAYWWAWDTAGIFGLGRDAGGLRTKIEVTPAPMMESEIYLLLLLAVLGLVGIVARARHEAVRGH